MSAGKANWITTVMTTSINAIWLYRSGDGWHAFRRGLAFKSEPFESGRLCNSPILHHANVSVTQSHYIKTVDADAVAAMHALEVSFADRSQKAAVLVRPRVN